jgi:hypothetical protein
MNTLEDNNTEHGDPLILISDCAQFIISDKIIIALRTLCNMSLQKEPYLQQQYPSERRYQTLKTVVNYIVYGTNAPPNTLLFCWYYG